MDIEYFGVTHIVFGTGKISQVGRLAKSYGKRVFIVTGSGSLDADQVLTPLAEQGITWSRFKVCRGTLHLSGRRGIPPGS